MNLIAGGMNIVQSFGIFTSQKLLRSHYRHDDEPEHAWM